MRLYAIGLHVISVRTVAAELGLRSILMLTYLIMFSMFHIDIKVT
jgi:hypothetical protein